MPQSQGVIFQEKLNAKGELIYEVPEEEKKMVLFHANRIQQAKYMRNNPFHKFDNMTFIQDFYSNEDAVNSYLKPKRNDDDVRVVGGTTEKRIESVMNELLSMNWQAEIQAYDKDDMYIQGLGKAMEDVVTRTNQMEQDDDVKTDALWELITQRAVFMEELVEEWKVGDHTLRQCRKRLRSALEVFVGDVTISWYNLHLQPYIVIYDRMSLPAARSIYGHYDNFKYVRGSRNLSEDVYGSDVTFRLGILQTDEVEIVKYMSVPDNEYQIYINGVPMLPVGTKLPFQVPYPHYPISVAIPKRMGKHFFYGRSIASSLKYLQALNDETVRNIVRKFRQAIEPPKAVQSNSRIYSRDIFMAGQISYGVDANSLKDLVSHNGVTAAETQVFEMIKSMQDEFAARGNAQLGIAGGPKQTATAVIEQQKQAIKMLGLLVLAWSGFVRDMTKMRLFNILQNLTEPEGKEMDEITHELREKFKRFTLRNQTFENGKTGDKIVQFIGRDLSEEEQRGIMDIEEEEERKGRPVRISMINVKKLKEVPIFWYITTVSKPKESDDLHRLMFQDKLSQAQGVSQITQRPLNGDRVVDEFERTWRIKDWFTKPEEQGPQMPGIGLPPKQDIENMQATNLNNEATKGIEAGAKNTNVPNPSLAALSGALEGGMPG